MLELNWYCILGQNNCTAAKLIDLTQRATGDRHFVTIQGDAGTGPGTVPATIFPHKYQNYRLEGMRTCIDST